MWHLEAVNHRQGCRVEILHECQGPKKRQLGTWTAGIGLMYEMCKDVNRSNPLPDKDPAGSERFLLGNTGENKAKAPTSSAPQRPISI
jgi:hypothetical protein